MSHKRYSNEEMVILVLKALLTNAVITDFCKQYGISRSIFYQRRKAVLTLLSEGM
jgi:ACT domain-containing protein